MVWVRLLLATGAVRRVSGKGGAYRLRNELPWPAFSAGVVPRIRSESVRVEAVPPGNVMARQGQGPSARGSGLRAGRWEGSAGPWVKGECSELGVAAGWKRGGGWWSWLGRWGRRKGGGEVTQMELPLRREEALSRVRVVRNDFREAEEEGGGTAGGGSRRGWVVGLMGRGLQWVRRWLDGLAFRLAGESRG